MYLERKKINGSRIVLETLYRLGIRDIFGYPGGAVIPIYDEIYSFKKINHYFSRHEQGSAHEADGYARASGRVGVCLATSGPGATNLVTGIMTAHMDSTPMIAITGQIALPLLGKDAFQESDIIGITQPITKMNYLVTDIRDLPQIIKSSYFIASTGRPGPVLIDIPKDIQLQEIDYSEFEELYEEELILPGYKPGSDWDLSELDKAVDLINNSKRPLIIGGAGLIKSKATKELKEFIEKTKIPITTTLLGLGAYPSTNKENLGMLGMHGVVPANYATNEADLIIAAGIRFDDRITGDTSKFCKNAKIIHIDIDPAEINKNIKADVPIIGDLKYVLEKLNNEEYELDIEQWLETIENWKEKYPLAFQETNSESLMPQQVLKKANEIMAGDFIVTTDVGQHQMWTAQYVDFKEPYSMVSSGGAGTMGFGLPSAIGAQVSRPDKKVLAVVGDGSFQMTFQELSMINQYDLPIKVLILNNSYLGMVRQWQELFNDRRYSFVDLDYSPDFEKLGESYGIKAVTLSNKKDLEDNLEELLTSDEAVIINCIVEKEANVLPMIPAGESPADMVGKKGVLNG